MTKYSQRLCFLDLETTGFSPEKDSIIELSFVVLDKDGNEESRFDQVITPEKSPLNDFVAELTGISQAEIDKKSVKIETVKDEVLSKIGDAVIVGHNIDFDINFLEAYGVSIKKNGRIDTHELARIILLNEESYALEILATKYGFKHENAHRAMSDVEVNIDVYDFLVEQIENLTPEFLAKITPIIKRNEWWIEGQVLLESTSSKTVEIEQKAEKIAHTQTIDMSAFAAQKHNFVRAGNIGKTAELQKNMAYSWNEKSLIVTDRLDRFEGESFFPTPEVLLDPAKLETFCQKDFSQSIKLTFAIQALWRHELGFRGKNFFDLFMVQYDLWNEICITDTNHERFQNILIERTAEKLLVLTPETFLRFIDLPIFAGRKLIIDEAEQVGEKLLHAPSQEFSLLKYLNSDDEKISTAAQFWIANFCQEVIKTKTGHEISPFPTKILLKEHDKFADFADSAKQFLDESDSGLVDLLSDPAEKQTRWLTYLPRSGDIQFGAWHPNDWRLLKEKLAAFDTVIFYRHNPSESLAFFRIFLGISAGEEFEFNHLQPAFDWIVPNDLISNRSPEYNSFCAQKIAEISNEKISNDSNIVASFSSLETLKKTYSEISETLKESDISIFGERVKGGRGKMFQMMKDKKNVLLLLQKISHKELEKYPFKHLVLQRIPFPAPHPLLEKLEEVMKKSGQNFWEIWTTPQVSAALSRKTADFDQLESVICLDGRENAKWARPMIYGAWPHLNTWKK